MARERLSSFLSASAAGAGRINWLTVLDGLPKQFKASNVGSVRGLGTSARPRFLPRSRDGLMPDW